jgi:hypothetical protein
MTTLTDPRKAQAFRFVRHTYTDGVAELVYAFDNGAELIERITFPGAPALPAERSAAFAAALRPVRSWTAQQPICSTNCISTA